MTPSVLRNNRLRGESHSLWPWSGTDELHCRQRRTTLLVGFGDPTVSVLRSTWSRAPRPCDVDYHTDLESHTNSNFRNVRPKLQHQQTSCLLFYFFPLFSGLFYPRYFSNLSALITFFNLDTLTASKNKSPHIVFANLPRCHACNEMQAIARRWLSLQTGHICVHLEPRPSVSRVGDDSGRRMPRPRRSERKLILSVSAEPAAVWLCTVRAGYRAVSRDMS